MANSSLLKVKRITQKLYFTKGKVDQIAAHILKNSVDCVFINSELKPGQIRNITKIIESRLNNQSLPSGYGIGMDDTS